jgi:hypothetical protein
MVFVAYWTLVRTLNLFRCSKSQIGVTGVTGALSFEEYRVHLERFPENQNHLDDMRMLQIVLAPGPLGEYELGTDNLLFAHL